MQTHFNESGSQLPHEEYSVPNNYLFSLILGKLTTLQVQHTTTKTNGTVNTRFPQNTKAGGLDSSESESESVDTLPSFICTKYL